MQVLHTAQPELQLLLRPEQAGGTYTAPAGVVINAATGDIELWPQHTGNLYCYIFIHQSVLVATRRQPALPSMRCQQQRLHMQVLHIAQPVLQL